MGLPAESEDWDYSVLQRAYEALNTPTYEHAVTADPGVYDAAYAYCARLIYANSRTFHVASTLLPEPKRRAVRALYAFCRATDDLIDQVAHPYDARRLMEGWRARLANVPTPYDPLLLAWADTKAQYRIPHGFELQLLEGIARDLTQQRYTTFAELVEYCYGVASTVGLMVMHIVAFESHAALRYAVKLGIALQLTNILRDIGADWQVGRLYLPLEELARFGLSEADIASGQIDDRWRAFMRFQIDRTRALYREAESGIGLLHPEGRVAIAAAAGLYKAILNDIEAHDYDVFTRRAHIGTIGKLRRLPAIWWSTRRATEPIDERSRLPVLYANHLNG